jgi:hypothetical protein
MIHSNDTSYVTRPIFTEYVTSVILPYFAATRESLHPQGFTGVLLCDNCSSHIDEADHEILSISSLFLPNSSIYRLLMYHQRWHQRITRQ